ncbi:hypothetical protein [Streptomyces sp. NPDC005548]|uniref:hypothetical protein n=1 Tax=Streptomyces sp. NPDC005548 TaxID=3364724 RepID=UPI0036B0D460
MTTIAPAVSLATIMTVNARTWLDWTDDGEPLAALMLTHPSPQFGPEVDPAAVEATMRTVATSLGAVPAGDPVPDVGVKLTLHGSVALLWFPGAAYSLKITHARWVHALSRCSGVLLAVGLDELSTVASVAEVDEYRENGRESGRLQFALAHCRRGLGGAL